MQAVLIERLLRQAHLFDDPAAYAAGVHDTVQALRTAGAPSSEEQHTPATRPA